MKIAVAALSLTLLALGAAGGAQAAVDPTNMEELFLEAKVGRTTLSSDVAALWDTEADTVYLSLVELAESLGLAAAESDGGLVGFLRDEGDIWRLEAASGRLSLLSGEVVDVSDHLVDLDGALYLSSAMIERLWPLRLTLDTGSMRLSVEALEPLPAISAVERKARWDRLNGRTRPKDTAYPDLTTAAGMWSAPSVDVEAGLGYETKEGASGSYGAVVAGDLLGMAVSGFIAGDEESPLRRIRLRGEMRDPGDNLFGLGLGISSLAVGDVLTPGLPLVVDTIGGVGVSVNGLESAPTDYTSTRVEGDALPGWDAELYINGDLISAAPVDQSGRYAFDVPLSYGINFVRVMLYGPQGQQEEIRETYRIGGQMARPGEVKWRLGGVLPNSELVPLNDEDNFHLRDRSFLDEPKEDPLAAGVGSVSVGVMPGWSVGAGFGWVPNEDRRSRESDHLFGTANILGNVLGASVRLDAAIDDKGQAATGAVLGTELMGFSITASHAQYQDGFQSPTSGYGASALSSESEIVVSRTFRPAESLPSLSVAASYERETTQGGRKIETAQLRLSSFVGGVSLSNTVGYRTTEGRKDTAGVAALAGEVADLPLRLAVGYTLAGDTSKEPGIDYLDLSIPRLELDEVTTFRPRITYGVREGDFRASGTLSRDFGRFRLGVSALYSTEGGIGVGFTIGSSFGPDPYHGGVRFSDKSLASGGSIAAHAYLDHDANGRFDEGDKPLEGVQFAMAGRRLQSETDTDGTAYLDGLAAHERGALTVVQGSLGDAYYAPQQEGYEITLRPGAVETVAFPIVEVAEIEGTAITDSAVPASGTLVRLVDGSGKTVGETIIAPDGYFYFGSLRPGVYELVTDQIRTKVELSSGELQNVHLTVLVANNLG